MENAIVASANGDIIFNPNAAKYLENTSFWVSRHQVLADSGLEANADIVICLTLYNESFNDLSNSLISIARNIKYLKTQESFSSRVKVCVIADGQDKLSASVIKGLDGTGLTLHEEHYQSKEEALHVAYTPISLEIDNYFEPKNFNIFSNSNSFDLIFCTKSKNCGKLDSHWWFFTKFCNYFEPEYCFQMDTGTVLEPQALAETLKTLRIDSSHAAVASNILIEPDNFSDLLQCYQSTDFIIQRGILWPAENIWGYLSVVPGQFCGMHWPSLSHDSGNGSPLSRYLKGMNCQTPSEKIMFLAEDRVMGFELMANKGSYNRLSYATNAECYTDSCGNVDELLKQRRRWINSAFLCRSWSIANMGRYWRDSGAPVLKKVQTLGSLTSMLWSHFFDWFQPLVFLLLLGVVGGGLGNLTLYAGIRPLWNAVGVITIGGLWLLPAILALTGRLQKCSKSTVQGVIALSSAATAFTLLMAIGTSVTVIESSNIDNISLPFFLYFCLSILLAGLLLGKNAFKLSIKTLIQYLLCCLPVNLMLNFYALTHMNDSSWGTKGLHQKQIGLSNKDIELQHKLNRFGFNMRYAWIASNLLTYAAIQLMHAKDAVTLVGNIVLGYYLFGLIGMAWLRLRRNMLDNKTRPLHCEEFTTVADS